MSLFFSHLRLFPSTSILLDMKFTWLIIVLAAVLVIWFLNPHHPSSALGAAAVLGTTTKPTDPAFGPYLYRKATFAGGCFWGTESAFRHTPGVIATTVGYTGGTMKNPTYEDVCTHTTGHAEAVLVTYDPTQISYAELLDVFWTSHDPTTLDRQGPDIGDNYRSAIFYHDADQERIAKESIAELTASHVFDSPMVTQVVPEAVFYRAEEYHQQYFEKQGGAAYCHVGPVKVHTKLAAQAAAERKAALARPIGQAPATVDKNSAYIELFEPTESFSDAELRDRLSKETYAVSRQADTERPFTGKYWNEHGQGVYRCPVCGQPLFTSDSKFDSGCGWPSFSAPITSAAVSTKMDYSHGMQREEVICSQCGSHLGHVFDDGSGPTHLRYCINSAAVQLNPANKSPAKASK